MLSLITLLWWVGKWLVPFEAYVGICSWGASMPFLWGWVSHGKATLLLVPCLLCKVLFPSVSPPGHDTEEAFARSCKDAGTMLVGFPASRTVGQNKSLFFITYQVCGIYLE